jgi:hyperosmotically inducible periplasmic protein
MRNIKAFIIASAFALSAAGCGSTGERSSVGENIDDSVITTKVKTLFVKDKKVDARDISVTTNKGMVELKGEVDSQEDYDKAIRITKGVAGVKGVKNNMTIKAGKK